MQVVNPYNGEVFTAYNLKDASLLSRVDNLITNSPTNRQVYNGFEVALEARLGNGGTILANTTTQRSLTDTCDMRDDPNLLRFCDRFNLPEQYKIPFKRDFKLAASYPVGYRVMVSATFTSSPGRQEGNVIAVDEQLPMFWNLSRTTRYTAADCDGRPCTAGALVVPNMVQTALVLPLTPGGTRPFPRAAEPARSVGAPVVPVRHDRVDAGVGCLQLVERRHGHLGTVGQLRHRRLRRAVGDCGGAARAPRGPCEVVAGMTRLAAAVACLVLLLTAAGHRLGAQPRPRLNPLIARLEAGQPALTPDAWMFIDMEHGPYLLDRLQSTLETLGKRKQPNGQFETAPIVRIPLEGDESFRYAVKQVLDMGAMGVVFPHIDTRAQAVEAIRSMRYPPQRGAKAPEPAGRRGWGPGRAAAYWGLPVNEYAFERADLWPLNPRGELFAMIMIESAEGVRNIDEIVKVPGVGAVFIGASDLGVSLGVGPSLPNGANAPETEAAVQKVLKACLAAKVVCAYPAVGDPANVKTRLDEGFKVLLVAGQAAQNRR